MTNYRIDTRNGQTYTATSMKSALAIARSALCSSRLYRGSEYQTDRPGKDGGREYVAAVDLWSARGSATREMSCMADAVISRG